MRSVSWTVISIRQRSAGYPGFITPSEACADTVILLLAEHRRKLDRLRTHGLDPLLDRG